MELKITNVGKISLAEIEIKGLTIIAGPNSTGKSTVSRSLFAMFHSFSKISDKITLEKIYAIQKMFFSSNKHFEFMLTCQLQPRELAAILAGDVDKNRINKTLHNSNPTLESSELVEELSDDIIKINSTSEELLHREIVSEIFIDEFNRHITNIRSNSKSEIELKIKDSKNKVVFDSKNELTAIEVGKDLSYEVVYIDDPFIINSYNFSQERLRLPPYGDVSEKVTNHRSSLISQYKNAENLTLVDKANLKEKLSVIYKKINYTLGADMELFENGKNSVESHSSSDRLSVDSLSSGMKTFYLIKSLIDNGSIVQNTTLILDEPEVHLHPDWQVSLAEIIVLLQKEMGLHILINTHSPYFLRAIEVYSQKYGINSCVKYYLSYNEEEISKIKDVTLDISKIYKVLSKPLQRIEDEA
jgi:hypothetical protein